MPHPRHGVNTLLFFNFLFEQSHGTFNVRPVQITPSDRRKRPWVRRTLDPRFKALQPGEKIGPVNKHTAISFVTGARSKGWVVWQAKIGPESYEVGRDA